MTAGRIDETPNCIAPLLRAAEGPAGGTGGAAPCCRGELPAAPARQARASRAGAALAGLADQGARLSPSGRPKQNCGALGMRIARDGSWHYQGSPIGRKELVCLFASVLRREPDGSYWLETPVERGQIEVEDAPFIAVEVFWRRCDGRQCLTFRTNLDEMVTADADHPIRIAIDPATREPRPYVTVRPGLEARINRAVFYELVALAEPEPMDGRDMLGVWSEGVFFPIDEVPPEPPARKPRKAGPKAAPRAAQPGPG